MGKDAAESMRPGEAAIREAAAELRAHRKRPCLLYISRQVAYSECSRSGRPWGPRRRRRWM